MIKNISILIALIAIFGCTENNDESEQVTNKNPETVSVTTHTLTPQKWQGEINTFGVVEAAEEINLSLDFSGIIRTVLVKEGERVEKGQLLIELDQEKRQLKYQQASEFAIQTKAALDEAYLNLERRNSLAAQNTVSREVLDNAKLSVDRVQAQYREAMAAQQLASRELNDSKIFSPVNGVVDIKAVEPGENIQAGSTLLTLQAVETLRVLTWVSEKDVNLITNDATAEITLSGLPGNSFIGSVESIGVNAHSDTGNFPVKLIIEQNSGAIRPGMTASLTIKGLELANVLILPEAALVDRNRKRVVFVVENKQARAVEPLLTAAMGNQFFILSGLNAGEQVIISPLNNIVDGTKVITSPN